jgi:hypothetical protein
MQHIMGKMNYQALCYDTQGNVFRICAQSKGAGKQLAEKQTHISEVTRTQLG